MSHQLIPSALLIAAVVTFLGILLYVTRNRCLPGLAVRLTPLALVAMTVLDDLVQGNYALAALACLVDLLMVAIYSLAARLIALHTHLRSTTPGRRGEKSSRK
ncbi:hypothetical protein [Streptomyces botrytidirepellens]|uniref:Uncharacterized protein n=1 Tax=Streptomyces botrytidirepellens TaxID=2486417 RepID=A0A3M8WTS1_9ACTN|nr:hypothetical protein [Streptomyces botrytidirepellens]RNG32151.1 hypothetical protein EEJ42_08250 [Streptomyces botrytidirepellens]